MKLFVEKEHYKVYNGSVLDLSLVIEPNSVDSIICDPPYEINFMNKGWDNRGIAFNKDTWKHCYDALKPGGYLLAFGATRTFHRIAVAIEDAGFEIRDTIMWLYGSGFPKSMNISKALEAKEKYGKTNTVVKKQVEQSGNGKEYKIKQTNNGAMGEIVEATRKVYIPSTELTKQWQGWGTALKPAYEPIIVARKPFKGGLVDNVLTNGVGGLNIDECRIKTEEKWEGRKLPSAKDGVTWGGALNKSSSSSHELGRFPANVIHDGSEEVVSGFPHTKSTQIIGGQEVSWGFDEETKYGYKQRGGGCFEDEGSASRYFYSAKASKKDRDEGLDIFGFEDEKKPEYCLKYHNGEERGTNSTRKNIHPTVKPCELMQYLIRLVTPRGGVVLDCFMGSGSTGKAVMFENRERNANYTFIGIDLAEEYCKLASARIDYALNKYEYELQKEVEVIKTLPLFKKTA